MIKKTVWIIDDDPIYQTIIHKIIKKSDIFSMICSFSNGQEAFDELLNLTDSCTNSPDLILLDVNMPIMDGWEFMDEMLLQQDKIKKNIVIYLVSSSIALEDKTKAQSYSNILGYLSKPITILDLVYIVSRL
ncbi:CheY-like chemotaxis protein [Flavobacterium sp. PL11]|jgi:CheY-like chemotaxis protein|uniref:response regulator n=1 Tax=Flavobacterium sp. PL11 TaxID=3071717 RepID=UPI002DFED6A6|nr:CheY-like chemotaxis protein [Flavobacterium sp. PL11]